MAETCTGTSSFCPRDVFSPNGQSCGNGLACASGVCTSPSKQCQTVGASMGLTTACTQFNDQSCQVACQDPSQANQCIVLQSPLVDGSPCGLGGTCTKGRCQAGSFGALAKAWFTSHLHISVPVTVVVGLIFIGFLLALGRCLMRCWVRRSRKRTAADPALSGLRGERLSSWDSLPQPSATNAETRNFVLPPPVPRALRPGSRRSYMASDANSEFPPFTRSRSNHRPLPSIPQEGPRRQHRVPDAPRTDWVDETLYNGPRNR